ncbi:MAG: hypothetical protein Q8O87_01460 [bacterium]|nr:hypothetical protein [bacterium]
MDIRYSDKQWQKRNFWLRIKFYLVSGGLLLILILFFYFLQSPVFRIDTIEVEGLRNFTQEEFLNNLKPVVLNHSWAGALGFYNYIVWLKDINYDHPAVLNIEKETDFKNRKLILHVQERDPYGIWCAVGHYGCKWFDASGVLFASAPETEGFLIYKINSQSPPTDSRPLGFQYIIKDLALLADRDILVSNIQIDERLQEINIETYEGADIILSSRFDSSDLLASALEAIVKKTGLKNVKYLDLTVENRIYYK